MRLSLSKFHSISGLILVYTSWSVEMTSDFWNNFTMLENCYLNFLTTLHLLKRFESYLRQGIRFLQLILPEKAIVIAKLNMQNLGHKIVSFCGWCKCMTPIAINLWWKFGLKMLVFLEWGKSYFPLQAYKSFISFLSHFPIPHISIIWTRNGSKLREGQSSSHLLVIGFRQIRSRIFILIPVPTNLIGEVSGVSGFRVLVTFLKLQIVPNRATHHIFSQLSGLLVVGSVCFRIR